MEIQKKYGINESEKASELFSHVTNRLHRTLPAEREKLFEEFLRIFTAEAAYYDVAKQMMEKYGMLMVMLLIIISLLTICIFYVLVERNPAYKGPMRTLIEG